MHYNDELVITWRLDAPYRIDTVVVIGELDVDDLHMLVGGFEVHIGFDINHNNNEKCPNGPFLSCDSGCDIGRGSWPGGFEAWCGLEGNYVSLVREAPAAAIENDVRICTLGIISDGIPLDLTQLEETQETLSQFEQAKILFDAQFYGFLTIGAGNSTTVEIDIATDPSFEALSFETNFGLAKNFSHFDETVGKLLIEPTLEQVGSYQLSLKMIGFGQEYTRIMHL